MIISAFQLGAIVVGVMLSLGPLFIGRIAVEHAGRDGWLVTIVVSVLMLVNMWLVVKLAERYPNQTISAYSEKLLGKWFGKFVGFIWFSLAILSCSITLWYAGHLFNTYILLMTPSYIIALLLMALSTYVALCDLRTLGRVVVLILFISVPFNIFFFPPMLNHGDWLNILPLFENDMATFGSGMVGILFAFAGFEVIQTYYPYVRDKKNVMKHALWAIGFVSVLFILAVLTQQLVYPLEYLKKIWVPSVQYVALVSFPILERTDMIFIMLWFIVLFKTNTIYFYRAVLEAQHLLQISSKNLLVVILAILAYGLSFVSLSTIQMEKYLIVVFTASVTLSIFLTILLLLVDTLKKRRLK